MKEVLALHLGTIIEADQLIIIRAGQFRIHLNILIIV